MTAAEMTDGELAVALYAESVELTDATGDRLIELENEACARIGIDLAETEQGLTPEANRLIAEFCAAHVVPPL